MIPKVTYLVLGLVPGFVIGAEAGSSCTTPNGEAATCIKLSSCKIIKDAISTGSRDAIKFARTSVCGNVTHPLVCCGSSAYKAVAGPSCTTPNGESATCKPLASCRVVLQALVTLNKDAIEFARRSQCHNDKSKVCCGSEGYRPRSTTTISISPLLPNRTLCGLTQGFRVFGGQLTDLREHPWMALLRYRNFDGTDAGFKCGGSVINERYVLTAAHCVSMLKREQFRLYDKDSVRLGEWRISTNPDCDEGKKEECADPVVDLNIEHMIVHPKYSRYNNNNDIALLRLEKNVQYTDYIKPICLPEHHSSIPAPGTNLVVVGWGSTENRAYSDYKLKAEVPTVSRNDCEARQPFNVRIAGDQICAGGTLRKDSCRGDSGGPLIGTYAKLANEPDQWYQEGIVSWGIGCGVIGRPGIYTRVPMHIQWIVENLKVF